MNFDEFCSTLQAELTKAVEQELHGRLTIEQIPKNMQVWTGLSFVPAGSRVGMTVYAEDAFVHYQRGITVSEIVNKMVTNFKKADPEVLKEIQEAVDKEAVSENIVPAFIPRVGNESLLERVPHVPFQGLEIIFKFNLKSTDGMATLHNEHLEKLGIHQEELLKIATSNARFKDEIVIQPIDRGYDITDIAKNMELEIDLDSGDSISIPMTVITNQSKFHGAAAILDAEAMEKVSSYYEDDLYIIPDSIHECLLVPKARHVLAELRQVLQEMNQFMLPPGEKLSDDIYYFDRRTKKIDIATQELERSNANPVKKSSR